MARRAMNRISPSRNAASHAKRKTGTCLVDRFRLIRVARGGCAERLTSGSVGSLG